MRVKNRNINGIMPIEKKENSGSAATKWLLDESKSTDA